MQNEDLLNSIHNRRNKTEIPLLPGSWYDSQQLVSLLFQIPIKELDNHLLLINFQINTWLKMEEIKYPELREASFVDAEIFMRMLWKPSPTRKTLIILCKTKIFWTQSTIEETRPRSLCFLAVDMTLNNYLVCCFRYLLRNRYSPFIDKLPI